MVEHDALSVGSSMMNHPFDGEAHWIWCAEEDVRVPGSSGTGAVFRRSFHAPSGARLVLHVSADSAYRLRLNGEIIGHGPARGDPGHWSYDTYRLGGKVIEGVNTLSAEVVAFSPSWPDYEAGGPPVALMAQRPAFILDGWVVDAKGRPAERLSTNTSWQGAPWRTTSFPPRPGIPCAGTGEETVLTEEAPASTAVRLVAPGVSADNVIDSPLPYRLEPSMIPGPSWNARTFTDVFDVAGWMGDPGLDAIAGGTVLTVPAESRAGLLLDAGVLTTGYPELHLEGEGVVRLSYSERLSWGGVQVRNGSQPHEDVTGPMWDRVSINGEAVTWTPFFRRTFRFIRVEAESGSKDLRVHLAGYTATSCLLPPAVLFASSEPRHAVLDEISARTLLNCAQDIFEDGPYYEQLQYAGDVHVQCRAAYWMTGDTALARQAVLAFARSVNGEGLTASRWPSRVPQIIPLWSLHWILTLYEYDRFTGDDQTVAACLPAADCVLNWFLSRRGSDGLIHRIPYWMFADWSPDWPMGIPPGAGRRPSALVHFILISALRAVAELHKEAGEHAAAESLFEKAEDISHVSRAAFSSPRQVVYRDTPDADAPASRLANAWAILSGTARSGETKKLADAIFREKELSRESLFGGVFVFDAMLRAGRPELAEQLLVPYRDLIEKGFTTWPEDTGAGRSECHGWSNLPGPALRRLYLGVSWTGRGARAVRIAPYTGSLERASGSVPLAAGNLLVAWARDKKGIRFEIDVPAGIEAILEAEDGFTCTLKRGGNRIERPVPVSHRDKPRSG